MDANYIISFFDAVVEQLKKEQGKHHNFDYCIFISVDGDDSLDVSSDVMYKVSSSISTEEDLNFVQTGLKCTYRMLNAYNGCDEHKEDLLINISLGMRGYGGYELN